jgi:hypothetical protein
VIPKFLTYLTLMETQRNLLNFSPSWTSFSCCSRLAFPPVSIKATTLVSDVPVPLPSGFQTWSLDLTRRSFLAFFLISLLNSKPFSLIQPELRMLNDDCWYLNKVSDL